MGPKIEIERKRKCIVQMVKKYDLKLDTATPIVKRTDYLEIILDSKQGIYEPYNKPNNELMYVHAKTNHPQMMIKQVPKIVNDRISLLSASEEIFKKSKHVYKKAFT